MIKINYQLLEAIQVSKMLSSSSHHYSLACLLFAGSLHRILVSCSRKLQSALLLYLAKSIRISLVNLTIDEQVLGVVVHITWSGRLPDGLLRLIEIINKNVIVIG